MVASKRDDFKPNTKSWLAMRAAYRCSMPGCGVLTVGPSDESPTAIVNVGVAAHIHAAAPGGRRYNPNMTEEERIDIRNGIWLCGTHSIEVDRDESRYTADVLRCMKDEHERNIGKELNAGRGCYLGSNLISIGPNVVGFGELSGTSGKLWSIRIDHFIEGSLRTLIGFCEQFGTHDPFYRYVIVNALGDGRQLASGPSWRRIGASIELSCLVEDSFPRTDAHKLGKTYATNRANDIFGKTANITEVSGVDALPQLIKCSLSLLTGESPFHPLAGSHIKEYFDNLENSPWLQEWIKLEVIRLACIPYKAQTDTKVHTLIPSVLHVESVELVDSERKGDWLDFRFKLDVQGIGPWEQVIPIFVPVGDIPTRPSIWDALKGK